METVVGCKQAALDYCARGWSVLPLLGKTPRVDWKERQSNRASYPQVEGWWNEWPEAGVGVVLGGVSNLVRIDANSDHAATEFRRLFGDHDDTASFRTPNNGFGWLFQH